jgi:hypothetical protein
MVRSDLDSGNSESSTRACYIAGGHANKASFCSWKPAQPWPCSSGEEPSPGFQPTPFSDQPWTQTTDHGVSTELDFPCCYF